MSDIDVLVIGGGISGLATAWRLARRGISVEVWDREKRPGGKISSARQDGYVTERAASMVMNFRPEITHFLGESGVDIHKVRCTPTKKRYLVNAGRLGAIPNTIGAALMRAPFSRRGRARLMLEPFIPKGGHESETVSAFVRRRFGNELLEGAMDSFVAGTLASDPDHACARAVLPRLTALENRYGSIALGVIAKKLLRRRSAMPNEAFSFAGGMGTLVESLAAIPGVGFRPGRTVTKLIREQNGWRVEASSSDGDIAFSARTVVLCTPAKVAARLVGSVDADLQGMLAGIDYAPLSVVHLGFSKSDIRHPLDGAGFLAPRREGLAINGCLWPSSLFSGRAPAGRVLLSCYLGGARNPAAASWDDRRSIDAVLSSIVPLLDIRGTSETVRIDRHREALPLYHGRYLAHMRDIDRRLADHPGLHLEANYKGGVSVRDRILCAYKAADRIEADLGTSAKSTCYRLAPGDSRYSTFTGSAHAVFMDGA